MARTDAFRSPVTTSSGTEVQVNMPAAPTDLYHRAPCGLLRCATDGTVRSSNLTLRRWLGYPPDHRFIALSDILSPPSQLFFEMQLRPLLALGKTIDGAFVLLRRLDGDLLPVVMNAVQHPDDQSIEVAVLVVREREQYEASLKKAHSDAEQAMHAMAASAHAQKMQAVGQMAAGMAHEFNNLLTVVQGHIEFAVADALETVPASRGILEDLGRAAGAATRMAGIVRQLLAFTGQRHVRIGLLDLNTVVEASAQLVTHALAPDTIWETQLEPALWPVAASRDQMEQLFTSLVLNASEAVAASGRAGRITIATQNVPVGTLDARDHVRLIVSDTGIGMTEDVRERAIDPFFSTKGMATGLGLGLSMAYGSIRALQGNLEIRSTPHVGTSVTIILPRAQG
ncbi:ATP-binding protein [Gemmatimonas sp.]|uniref:sensor histidine kinase n=1 Tax=Gemmatimonas sp. TaxID=1962908 RepID=UPI00286CBDA5|nr:ATP-binding protein [Gemmatimonas sp.]